MIETVPASDLTFESARLPSQQRIWSWVKTINGFGPRLTGNDAHTRCVDFIAAEFERLGLTVMRDSRHFQRWLPERWSLTIADESQQDVPIAYPFPYSGRTPPVGVTGDLVWFDGPPHSFRRAAGKIAVLDVGARLLSPCILRLTTRLKAALPANAKLTRAERTPLLSGLTSRLNLKRAAEDGVLGLICVWHGFAEDDIKDQYLPFTTPLNDCPTLWVGPAAGNLLRTAHRRGEAVNLTLDARIDNDVRTDTIYTILPGRDAAETIIVNTHSDGPNAAEENGAAGLLALAGYLTSLPQASRRRTVVFVVATGHFQLPQLGNGGQATKTWLDSHPELWDGAPGHDRAIAGLTLEHLGCREWKEDDGGNSYGPTGRLERELVYATNATMQNIYRAAVEGRTKLRALVVQPCNGIFLGEGEPLFNVGIPSISLCPIPNYLCTVGGDIGRLDPEFMMQQIITFVKALLLIDSTPAHLIGSADPDRTAFIGRLFKSVFSVS